MLTRLLRHLIWADERTARALASLPAPDADLIKRYAHILGAEAVWLERVTGSQATSTPWPDLDAIACEGLARRNHAAIDALIDTLSPATLARTVAYTNTKGVPYTNTVEEILHHVAMHGMYHRGQIAMGVRRLGGVPLPTDFIAFVREAEGTAPH